MDLMTAASDGPIGIPEIDPTVATASTAISTLSAADACVGIQVTANPAFRSKLRRAQITDRRVSAFWIVEALDVVEHICSCFIARPVCMGLFLSRGLGRVVHLLSFVGFLFDL